MFISFLEAKTINLDFYKIKTHKKSLNGKSLNYFENYSLVFVNRGPFLVS